MSEPLAGRAALITGASRGLGREIARHYVRAGADVMLCARSTEALEETREALAHEAAPGQRVRSRAADVSQPHAVELLAEAAIHALGRIDILVNSAGVLGPAGATETLEWSAWLRALEVNLLGSVLTCRALLGHFKRRGAGKIVQISGGGATQPLPGLSAYAAAKAAIVRFVETLAEETRAYGIEVNALAPGPLDTRLLDELLAAGPDAIGVPLHERCRRAKAAGPAPLERAAQLAVFLASSASDGITGRLLSAPFDPWITLPRHRAALGASDIYTLRRIVPEDRGQDWNGT